MLTRYTVRLALLVAFAFSGAAHAAWYLCIPPDPATCPKVEAPKIAWSFRHKPKETEKKYGGKWLAIRGEVLYVKHRPKDKDYYVELSTEPTGGYVPEVFLVENDTRAAKLKVGDKVTVFGLCAKQVPSLRNARILPPPEAQ